MSQASHGISVRAPHRFELRRALAALFGILASRLRSWQLRARQRHELRELDDAMLRDVGMSRSQARFDADREFWRE